VSADDSSGYADWRGTDIAAMNPAATAEVACDKCIAGRGAAAVSPGKYAVILEPAAVAELISTLGYLGLGALSLLEGRSFLCDRLGEKVVSERITIWDDATDSRGLAMPFDWEGQPRQKVMLIEKGIARGVVYDSRTANLTGRQTTGHALPAPNTAGPLPVHLFLAPGESTLQEMIASTERGILVTRFHYVNVVHEKQTVITGMTRDGTFLVKDGTLDKPLSNLRFTQSILAALEQTHLVGREATLNEYAYVPALKISEFAFTS